MIQLFDTERFTEKFLATYLHGGLGSLSKKDTESLIVWLILNHSKEYLDADGKPNYTKLTLALKIPQRRVMDLLSHARLRFEQPELNDKIILSHIAEALLKTAYIKESEFTIKFTISDELVRQALENEVRKRYGIFENYFNRENISVDVTTLGAIMADLCSSEQWAYLKKSLAKGDTKEAFFISLLKDTTREFGKSLGQEGGKIVARGVAACITSGVSEVLEFLKS